jgi:RNA-splicing ligase RtcB
MTPITLQGKYTNAVVMTQTAESTCLEQIRTMINSPAFDKQVVIMPDTHAGKGSVVGFTMPMGDKIVPNCIGVDIGCGIYAYEIGYDSMPFETNWEMTDTAIRNAVPLGFSVRDKPYKNLTTQELERKCQAERHLSALLTKLGLNVERTLCQVGTLGGGNHFIEIAKSQNTGKYWLILHTGSRNLGKQVAEYHQKKAVEYVNSIRKSHLEAVLYSTNSEDRQFLIDTMKASSKYFGFGDDLAFLEGTQKEEYLRDMFIAQRYAHVNKEIMAEAIASALGISFTDNKIRSVHNYIDFSDNIIRKGATRANLGELFVVPFNMRDGTLVCRGKGSKEWNSSAPHGAGRVLARGRAKRELKYEDFKETMKNVWSSSVCSDTLDESPMAYKLPAEIEEAIQDTCEIVDRLIPVYNLKASEKTD